MSTKLRIATFNLENLDDKPRQTPTLEERVAVMRPQLVRLNADILCLQEVNGQEKTGQPRCLLALERLGDGDGLDWTYYDMDADIILQRGETCHDKPDWMRREPCIMSLSVELSAKR